MTDAAAPAVVPAPVVVTAVFRPAPERRAELADALSRSIPAVHQEEGCLLYAIHDAADGTITMIEKWTTTEALAAHAAGPAVAALQANLAGLLADPATVTTMTPIPAGTPHQGEL